MASIIVDGRKIADEIKREVKIKLDEIEAIYGVTPTIASIIIGNNSESEIYLKLRDRTCSQVGIESIHYSFPANVSEKKLLEVIKELNNDVNVHGILLQLPLPEHLSMYRLLSTIDPIKDVEGITPYNIGGLMTGYERVIPCTPLAVLRILEHEGVDLKGKNVTIVNHSSVVGKPLAILMLNRNATVEICHVYTDNLKEHTRRTDILITATGVPGLITSKHVKEGAVVIDVGITKTDDRVVGDVVFDEVKDIASIITPVPGGVGPVTIACSIENMLKTYRKCVKKR